MRRGPPRSPASSTARGIFVLIAHRRSGHPASRQAGRDSWTAMQLAFAPACATSLAKLAETAAWGPGRAAPGLRRRRSRGASVPFSTTALSPATLKVVSDVKRADDLAPADVVQRSVRKHILFGMVVTSGFSAARCLWSAVTILPVRWSRRCCRRSRPAQEGAASGRRHCRQAQRARRRRVQAGDVVARLPRRHAAQGSLAIVTKALNELLRWKRG